MTRKSIKFILAAATLVTVAVAFAFQGEWQYAGALALGAALVGREIPAAAKQ